MYNIKESNNKQNQKENPAVRLCFTNGLPVKDFVYLQHHDHYEDYYEEGDFGLTQQEFNQTKIMIINWFDVKKEFDNLIDFHFKDNMIWLEFEYCYGICSNLSQNIIDYIQKNKSISLAFFVGIDNEGYEIIKLTKEKKFNSNTF